MIDLDMKHIEQCNKYIVNLSKALDYVCKILLSDKNVEVIKIYVKEFGCQFEELVKFIQSNKFLNQKIFSNEIDLKFALESFGEAFSSHNYDLCSEILKYEIKYILFKWQRKLRINK